MGCAASSDKPQGFSSLGPVVTLSAAGRLGVPNTIGDTTVPPPPSATSRPPQLQRPLNARRQSAAAVSSNPLSSPAGERTKIAAGASVFRKQAVSIAASVAAIDTATASATESALTAAGLLALNGSETRSAWADDADDDDEAMGASVTRWMASLEFD